MAGMHNGMEECRLMTRNRRKEKLGRSHGHQTHTTNNTNTNFTEEKEEINGRPKNSK